MARQASLIDAAAIVEGFRYQPGFLDVAEEAALLDDIAGSSSTRCGCAGDGRRRVIQYGWNYSFENFKMTEGPPLPAFLLPVRARAVVFAGVDSSTLSEGLLMEYSPGAAIGWHRDAPPFGDVVGISLLSGCRFRFRRGKVRAWETRELPLEPRSAYVLRGPARKEWEHSIPPVKELRYSITFRTLRNQQP